MATTIVNTHEAKSRLSEPPRPERRPGAWAGKVQYHSDIVGPDEDVTAMFFESADGAPS